jgi:hypothetical protein
MQLAITGASSLGLGASGVGFCLCATARTSWYGEAAGRKKGDATRRAKLCGKHRAFG